MEVEKPSPDDEAAALAFLSSSPRPPMRATVRRGLLHIALSPSHAARDAAVVAIVAGRTSRVQELWRLWLDLPKKVLKDHAEALATALATKASQRSELLPPWYQASTAEPALPVVRDAALWVFRRQTPVELSSASCGIPLDTARGRDLVFGMLNDSAQAWWQRPGWYVLRRWASESLTPGLHERLVDLALTWFAGPAASPGGLPDTDDADLMLLWATEVLGDPLERPGAWAERSERGREVYEWLRIRREFGKILAEFRSDAEDQRADFWEGYLPVLKDARLYRASNTSVCMMVIHDRLFIEFGHTGNATYVYSSHAALPWLRTLKLPRPRASNADWFKRTYGLSLPVQTGRKVVLDYVQKLSHISGWQSRFRNVIGRMSPQLRHQPSRPVVARSAARPAPAAPPASPAPRRQTTDPSKAKKQLWAALDGTWRAVGDLAHEAGVAFDLAAEILATWANRGQIRCLFSAAGSPLYRSITG